jgi:hypothetical protein
MSSEHPSLARRRISNLALLACFTLPPALWIMQLVANYALAALACFPNDRPLTPGLHDFGATRAAIIGINLFALAGCIAVGVYSEVLRRRAIVDPSPHELTKPGIGRARWLALWSMLVAFSFAAAVFYNTLGAVFAPECYG